MSRWNGVNSSVSSDRWSGVDSPVSRHYRRYINDPPGAVLTHPQARGPWSDVGSSVSQIIVLHTVGHTFDIILYTWKLIYRVCVLLSSRRMHYYTHTHACHGPAPPTRFAWCVCVGGCTRVT